MNYPVWKRFLISASRAFMVGFIIQFAQGILLLQDASDFTSKFLLGLIVGSLSAGLYALAKYIQEKKAGMI